jgi:hypothetical protein
MARHHLELRDEAVRRPARAPRLQQAGRQAGPDRHRDVRPWHADIDADPATAPVFPQGYRDRRCGHPRREEAARGGGDPGRLHDRNVCPGRQSAARAAGHCVPRQCQAGWHQRAAAPRAAGQVLRRNGRQGAVFRRRLLRPGDSGFDGLSLVSQYRIVEQYVVALPQSRGRQSARRRPRHDLHD